MEMLHGSEAIHSSQVRITPCSAEAGGSFSSRESSRSACLRTTSGSSSSASCSRSSSTSASAGSRSPSSSWIAFSCWRRMYSRWVWSISDWTCDWMRVPISTHLELAREDLREPAQPLGDVDLLEQRLALLGRDPQRAGDQVRERRRVLEVGHRHLQLLGQVRDLLDDAARTSAARCACSASSSGPVLDDVGQLGDARRRGRARSRPTPRCRTRWPPWTSTRSVPSGTLSMRATVPATPTS